MIDTLFIIIIQIAVILIATRGGSYLAIKIGIAPVLGELTAGIVLGPTLFGLLMPEAQAFIFPQVGSVNNEILQNLSWLGLIFLMFIGGLETNMGDLKENLGRALLISAGALFITLTVGFGFAQFLTPQIFPTSNQLALQLFFAIAMAITAIPVLIKILIDLQLLSSRFGVVIVAAGVIVDTAGWVLLALITHGSMEGFSIDHTAITVVQIIIFLIITFTLGRLILNRLVKLQVSDDALSTNFLAAVMALMLLGAATTQYMGIHPVLGAFSVGLMVGMWKLSHAIKEKIEDFAFSFFVPIFLANLGLRANLLLINTWELWGLTLIIILVFSMTTFLGGWLGSRIGRLKKLECFAAGIAVNMQGAMGLVAAKVGLDLGLIPANLYAILVVVAVVRTLISAFGLQIIRKPLLQKTQ